jgi:hypothetical protein
LQSLAVPTVMNHPPRLRLAAAVQYLHSPLLGNAPLKRELLCYFKGDMGIYREWWYSRGIRQTLYRCEPWQQRCPRPWHVSLVSTGCSLQAGQ